MSELPAGTVVPVGGPAPPTNSEKSMAAFLWAAAPVIVAVVTKFLQEAPDMIPGVDPGVWLFLSWLFTLLTPVAAAYGAWRKANTLKQPVTIM